jgi:hypothetical protein
VPTPPREIFGNGWHTFGQGEFRRMFAETNAFSTQVEDLKFSSIAMPQLTAVRICRRKVFKTGVVLKTSRIIANRTRPRFIDRATENLTGQPAGFPDLFPMELFSKPALSISSFSTIPMGGKSRDESGLLLVIGWHQGGAEGAALFCHPLATGDQTVLIKSGLPKSRTSQGQRPHNGVDGRRRVTAIPGHSEF